MKVVLLVVLLVFAVIIQGQGSGSGSGTGTSSGIAPTPGSASSVGDPHISTFDKKTYGLYKFKNSKSMCQDVRVFRAGNKIAIQSRLRKNLKLWGGNALNTGIAGKFDNIRFELDLGTPKPIFKINGKKKDSTKEFKFENIYYRPATPSASGVFQFKTANGKVVFEARINDITHYGAELKYYMDLFIHADGKYISVCKGVLCTSDQDGALNLVDGGFFSSSCPDVELDADIPDPQWENEAAKKEAEARCGALKLTPTKYQWCLSDMKRFPKMPKGILESYKNINKDKLRLKKLIKAKPKKVPGLPKKKIIKVKKTLKVKKGKGIPKIIKETIKSMSELKRKFVEKCVRCKLAGKKCKL